MPGFEVLSTEMIDGEWHVGIATPRDLVGCAECGAVARVKDRRTVTVRDLPAAGVPVVLKWRKRIFECRYALCPTKTWTEQHPAIASRAVLTDRARQWAFEQVGRHDRAVAPVAAVLGVAWNTIMCQVKLRGNPLVDDPRRLDGVSAVGVDETAFLRSCSTHPTLYATGLAAQLPKAVRVLDAFHVVKLALTCIDEVRRRTQQDTLGHRGHAQDPLFRTRRLLRRRADRLTVKQRARLLAALLAGDPNDEVTAAWDVAQDLMTAYANPDRVAGKAAAEQLITTARTCP